MEAMLLGAGPVLEFARHTGRRGPILIVPLAIPCPRLLVDEMVVDVVVVVELDCSVTTIWK